jgi:cytochrome c-type biogenesis protein
LPGEEKKITDLLFGKLWLLYWVLLLLLLYWELLRELWEGCSGDTRLVCGFMVILFGLNFLGVIRLRIFRGTGGMEANTEMGIISTFLFGIVFGLGWTPCIGAFLGSALMLASSQASWTQGILLLICYSVGLGIPFLISAVLIQKLKTTFEWIKRHYGIINKASGALLILVGILMMTGLMNQYLVLMS